MKVNYVVGSLDAKASKILIMVGNSPDYYSKLYGDHISMKLSKGEVKSPYEMYLKITGEYDAVKKMAEDIFDEKDFDNMIEAS
jgi:hypothetical protein